jgi:hypothetical protein
MNVSRNRPRTVASRDRTSDISMDGYDLSIMQFVRRTIPVHCAGRLKYLIEIKRLNIYIVVGYVKI